MDEQGRSIEGCEGDSRDGREGGRCRGFSKKILDGMMGIKTTQRLYNSKQPRQIIPTIISTNPDHQHWKTLWTGGPSGLWGSCGCPILSSKTRLNWTSKHYPEFYLTEMINWLVLADKRIPVIFLEEMIEVPGTHPESTQNMWRVCKVLYKSIIIASTTLLIWFTYLT